MGSLADQLRRSLSGAPAGCTCALDVAESLRRTIGGSDDLCRVHDVAAIEQRLAHERLAIERERHETLRRVVADRAVADAPACTCATVRQIVHAGFAGEGLPECALHAAPSQNVSAQMNIPIGDDQQLLGLLGQHGITPITNL